MWNEELPEGATHSAVWSSAIDMWALGCLIVRTVALHPLYAHVPGARSLLPDELGEKLAAEEIHPCGGVKDDPIGLPLLIQQMTEVQANKRMQARQAMEEISRLHKNDRALKAKRGMLAPPAAGCSKRRQGPDTKACQKMYEA